VVPELRTPRLLLRDWRESDLPAFAALNADPRVMEYLPALLSRPQSDAVAAHLQRGLEEKGFGFWALEAAGRTPFIGFLGLSIPSFTAHFTPCVEVGWRLACDHWGHGYATEAARAAVRFGFEGLGLSEIVSFTVPNNVRSRRVMEKLGMRHSPVDDFDHPTLPPGSSLRRHVLYRLRPGELPLVRG